MIRDPNPEAADMLSMARDFFREDSYGQAEPILNQLILSNIKSAEVFHMLGAIYYDQGKFNKAIRSFKRALEMDPGFTDASIGLSILLNDLGRYHEGQKIFDEAKSMLKARGSKKDAYQNERFATKHDELGEMYFQHERFQEGLEQFYKALNLSERKPELTMKIVKCYAQMGESRRASNELRELLKSYPNFLAARTLLGRLHYEEGLVVEAIQEWERVLAKDPHFLEAKQLLEQAQVASSSRISPQLKLEG